MGFSWKMMIILFVMVFAIMSFYNVVIKAYVLPKIKINKWVILALGIVMLIVTNFVGVGLRIDYNKFSIKQIPYYICMLLFILFFFAFFDLAGFGASRRGSQNRKGKKDLVIKPKAKPNRVKNKDKDKK